MTLEPDVLGVAFVAVFGMGLLYGLWLAAVIVMWNGEP